MPPARPVRWRMVTGSMLSPEHRQVRPACHRAPAPLLVCNQDRHTVSINYSTPPPARCVFHLVDRSPPPCVSFDALTCSHVRVPLGVRALHWRLTRITERQSWRSWPHDLLCVCDMLQHAWEWVRVHGGKVCMRAGLRVWRHWCARVVFTGCSAWDSAWAGGGMSAAVLALRVLLPKCSL